MLIATREDKKMPLKFEIPSRTVTHNSVTNQVLQLYEEALAGAGINVGELKTSTGLWAKGLAFLEWIFEQDMGSQYRTLPLINATLDAKVEAIVRKYINYINQLLLESGASVSDIIETKITDPNVLVGEILVRLIVIAFSIDQGVCEARSNKIAAAKKLIEKCLLNDIFKKNGNVSALGQALAVEHKSWIKMFYKVADITDKLHEHTEAMASLLAHLNLQRQIIKQQLLARLNTNLEKMFFLPQILDTKLGAEQQVLLPPQSLSTSIDSENSVIIPHRALSPMLSFAEQIKIIENTKVKKNSEELKKLYYLWNMMEVLIRLTMAIDGFLSITSWTAFISGILDLTNLTKIIKEVDDKCTDILNLNIKSEFCKTTSGQSLFSLNAASAAEIDENTLHKLNKLNAKENIAEIVWLLVHNIQEIIDLEKNATQHTIALLYY